MDNKLMVYNENNELEEIEILDFLQLEEYDHEYAFYTKNEEVGDDVVTYISIIVEVEEGKYRFEKITDEEELRKVELKLKEDLELLSEE
jgi:hypothetical protein